MKTNVSGLLRDFLRIRRAALAGEEVLVETRKVNLLLDTHAALWLVQGDDRLSDATRLRIERAPRNELLISDRAFVASALELHAELVTRNATIRESGLVPIVW